MLAPTAPFRPSVEALLPLVAAFLATRRFAAVVLALALLGGAYVLALAQVTGERGIAPTASSADIEVRGIEVDVRADTGEEAREKGWREAQRKAWAKAGGPAIADGQLADLVSAIVIEKERAGPKRYIATLGVIFDRQRAGRFLNRGGQVVGSAPMLLLPITASEGTYTTFEVRNPWQRAWAEFNPGASRITYVRPSGRGGDSLLLNFGQTGRRSRAWWRSTLDQYAAADALIPIARLEHQYPGGPITGTFIARYGPDSDLIGSFTLTCKGPEQLPEMLDDAVERMDALFQQALADGRLTPDPTLRIGGDGSLDPALARLLEIGRAVQAREAAAARAKRAEETGEATPGAVTNTGEAAPPPAAAVQTVTVQFASPDPMAFDAALSGVRGTPGVRGLAVTSTAMGGTSVMSVTFAGTGDQLAAALRARGFNVTGGGSTIAISR